MVNETGSPRIYSGEDVTRGQIRKLLDACQETLGQIPRCFACGSKTVSRKKPFHLKKRLLGHFAADVCPKCGEVFWPEESARKIEKVAKRKGLFGIDVKRKKR